MINLRDPNPVLVRVIAPFRSQPSLCPSGGRRCIVKSALPDTPQLRFPAQNCSGSSQLLLAARVHAALSFDERVRFRDVQSELDQPPCFTITVDML